MIEDACNDVMSAEDRMANAATALMADISVAESTVTANIAALKVVKDAVKKTSGDAEMILRKFNDDYAAMLAMGHTCFELDTELKKDMANKDLIKKHQIAQKALDRQTAA